jgi:cyanophycinase
LSSSLAGAQGITVAIGGALQDDNVAVWSRLVELAGGAGSRFTVFGTASSNPALSAARIVATLQRHGAVAQAVDVTPALPDDDISTALAERRAVDAVRSSRGVFFSGGDQARLIDNLRPGGQPTPLLLAVQEVWNAGGVVAGTSAGAAVMSRRVFRDAPDVLAVMKGRLREGREVDTGFGLLPDGIVVDQHSMNRGRIARQLPMLQSEGLPLGIGVSEDSAVVVRGQQAEVIGSRGALFVDIGAATTDVTLGAFNLRGARLHWLEAGDRYDIANGLVQPSQRKLTATRQTAIVRAPDPGAPPRTAAVFTDILDDGAIVRAMTRRLDSYGGDVLGLSFAVLPRRDDPDPDLGFEWRLHADASTYGHRVRDGATLVDLLLDVSPVRLARPLYTPLTAPASAMVR